MTHPFPAVAPQHVNRAGPTQRPQKSVVRGEEETEDPQALQPLDAPHPGQAPRVVEGQKDEEESPGQPRPPQGDQRVRDEDGRELGQADGVRRAHVQAQEGQREGVAHFLRHPATLQN